MSIVHSDDCGWVVDIEEFFNPLNKVGHDTKYFITVYYPLSQYLNFETILLSEQDLRRTKRIKHIVIPGEYS
jgi:hypothetical protein